MLDRLFVENFALRGGSKKVGGTPSQSSAGAVPAAGAAKGSARSFFPTAARTTAASSSDFVSFADQTGVAATATQAPSLDLSRFVVSGGSGPGASSDTDEEVDDGPRGRDAPRPAAAVVPPRLPLTAPSRPPQGLQAGPGHQLGVTVSSARFESAQPLPLSLAGASAGGGMAGASSGTVPAAPAGSMQQQQQRQQQQSQHHQLQEPSPRSLLSGLDFSSLSVVE